MALFEVCVLMSTYNGAKFLREQVDSIFNQRGVKVFLHVRDDGSNDGTADILKELAKTHENMCLQFGENIGAPYSFYELMKCSREYDFYAFADQDDVWDEDKLLVAVEKMCTSSPQMYYSSLIAVDEQLRELAVLRSDCRQRKNSALVENFASGCTVVFNRPLMNLALKYSPEFIYMHDFWLMQICTYLGEVIYDPQPHIKYRQHSGNAVGAKFTARAAWKNRIKSLRKLHERPREEAALQLLRGYGTEMNQPDVKVLKRFTQYRMSIKDKLWLIFNDDIRMQSIEKNFWLRIRMIIGRV